MDDIYAFVNSTSAHMTVMNHCIASYNLNSWLRVTNSQSKKNVCMTYKNYHKIKKYSS